MEHGNLHEYYMNYKDKMNWETKINFALDICCGISYLNDCQILHHDIQSANILVDKNDKIKITNFGLSKKFYDLTRNISPNIENVRYMAPEKLLTEDDTKKEKIPYDSKCEIYSVGALLWEIAELRKPHSDLNKSEILVGIRKRVSDRYCLPFSDGIPDKWKKLVISAMLHEPACRPTISEICRKLHKLSKEYSTFDDCPEDYEENLLMDIDDNQNTMPSFFTITILTVEDAIRTHKSKNGNKQLAWQSFKYHSVTDIYAKYMVGYYYYHEEVPELQKISKDERVRIAVGIFKETADKGNPSAQLRYGICLWQGEGIEANPFKALEYLEMAAKQGNSAAMYVIGKAYLNGGNGIAQDKEKGAEYLKNAALKNHYKAKELCNKYNIVL
ncbi:kinase-like domain-containing protein [Glomus cerebriforme]|uniref:Kinase-like domain-containing protein n=1 Tax=Glomus cerebriforme TaxID=658196 RepID=A0A397T8A1_9GLOM|nr:kinase-like domain-containing protein [Glomus cerebriforme]